MLSVYIMHIGSQFQVEVTLQMFSEEGILFDTFIRPQGYRKGFFGGVSNSNWNYFNYLQFFNYLQLINYLHGCQ